MEIDLGPIDQFRDHEVRVLHAGTKELAVARWGGKFFVFRNICPHEGGPIGRGALAVDLGGSVGVPQSRPDDPVAVCPWHHWEFALADGKAIRDNRYRIKAYPARVENGRLLTELTAQTSAEAVL